MSTGIGSTTSIRSQLGELHGALTVTSKRLSRVVGIETERLREERGKHSAGLLDELSADVADLLDIAGDLEKMAGQIESRLGDKT